MELQNSLSFQKTKQFLKNRINIPIEYDAKKRGYFYAEDFEIPLNAIFPG